MSDHPLTAEVSNSKLVAVFPNVDAARDAAEALLAASDIESPQLKLIAPDEADIGIKLEPEGRNIWRTIVVSHVRLGAAGALVGVLAFAVLWTLGVPFVLASPGAAGGVALFFGAIAGLLLGGLVPLRPDHAPFIAAARAARDEGRATLVLHALSGAQLARAAEFLGTRGAAVTRTL
jgi:hypothetical protein